MEFSISDHCEKLSDGWWWLRGRRFPKNATIPVLLSPSKSEEKRGECHWTHLLCANKRCDEMVREIFIHAEDRSRERGLSTTMWTKVHPILTTYPLSKWTFHDKTFSVFLDFLII